MSRRYIQAGAPVRTDVAPQQNVYAAQQPTTYQQPPVNTIPKVEQIIPWVNPLIMNPPPPPNQPERPPYFRTTVNMFPGNKQVLDNLGIPVSVLVSPAQVANVPVIDTRDVKLSRCPSCNAYLSPFHKILSETHVTCPFCGQNFQLTDTTRPGPVQTRPEFTNPVFDMLAPKIFNSLPDSGPSFCFIFDMTYEAVQSGFTYQMITSAKTALDSMNQDSHICIITMGAVLTAYCFTDHTEAVICDLTDISYISGCTATLIDVIDEIKSYFDYLLTQSGAPNTTNCLFSACEAALALLSGSGGVIVANFYGMPSKGPRAITARQATESGTEVELLRLPKGGIGDYTGKFCPALNNAGFSVHLFGTPRPNQSMELAIVGCMSGLTGGALHHYPVLDEFAFQDLHNDLFRTLTQEYYWDSSMRLRVSNGIKINSLSGNIYTNQHQTIIFPVMVGSYTVSFDLSITGDLPPGGALLQLAILFTNSVRQRVIRIFNFMLPYSTDIRAIGSTADEGAIATIILKQTSTNLMRIGPAETSNEIKKMITVMNNRGHRFQSILTMVHSLLNSDVLRIPSPFGVDGRMSNIIEIRSSNVVDAVLKMYPRFFALENPSAILPLTNQSFYAGNIFVLHTNKKIYIWVSPGTPSDVLQSVFGVSSISELPSSVPQTGTEMNEMLNNSINECYQISGRYLPSEIIPGGGQSPREAIVANALYDDSTYSGGNLETFLAQYR